MKLIAQNYKSGELVLADVPIPSAKPGGVVVRTEYSLISAGTEKMKVEESKLSLLGKARARPEKAKQVLDSVVQQGLLPTYRKVMNQLESLTPLGYSLSGTVVEVGAGVADIAVGQRVACAGNQFALHAEYNWVPRNLVAPIPDGVESSHAAFTTVCSIALQGYRQAAPALGETSVVIGLGLIGQLLVQLLHTGGVNAFGVDISSERCALAVSSGAAMAASPDSPDFAAFRSQLAEVTAGAGADYIFLAASTSSRQPVEMAAELARDRARIVDIGKCNLDLPWTPYYEKELDLRFSRSYGPGRYDPTYEEQGVDYPIGYVRWTENRNMDAVLRLMGAGRLQIRELVDEVVPFRDAVSTYERLHSGDLGGIGILFEYDKEEQPDRSNGPTIANRPKRTSSHRESVRLGAIGLGNYATSMLYPHLESDSSVDLVEVVTTSGLSAANASRRFSFERMSTDRERMLMDESIDSVVIATRHDSHAALVVEGLRAGKTVFVEKPLATSEEQLAAVEQAIAETGNDRLMVGYNRRFAPLLVDLKRWWASTTGPTALNYTVNAGGLAQDSWYAQKNLQGSRFIGEGCHFVDTASFLLDSNPTQVFATSAGDDPDNLTAVLMYPDGSRVTISYLTEGNSRFPKERIVAFGGGRVARLDNFKRVELWEGRKTKVKRSRGGVDKGQSDEMRAFVAGAKSGVMPIDIETIIATTRTTLAVDRSLRSGMVEAVSFELPKHEDV